MIGLYTYDFITGDVYAVPPRRSMRERTCTGSVLYGRLRPMNLEKKNLERAATERAQSEKDPAAAEGCRS